MTAATLHDYLHGELDQSQRQQVEREIWKYPETARVFSSVRGTEEQLQATFTANSNIPSDWLDLLDLRSRGELPSTHSERTKTWL
jgi:anti-sigma factor RsiW